MDSIDSSLGRNRGSSLKLAKDKLTATRQRRCLFGAIFGLLLLAVILASLSLYLNYKSDVEDVGFYNQHGQWRHTCDKKCDAKFKIPPLLLISLDGFRADYLQRNITPAVQRLMSCGTSAPYMYPSYPSKTFPNHYTIVTGLYPESHGIIDNYMYDGSSEKCKDWKGRQAFPDCGKFNKSENNGWWKGTPIWNTVMNERKKTATFFWPGSYFAIDGKQPDYAAQFNDQIPFTKRVDQVISWLTLPETERPVFMTMYFEQPDKDGHKHGPDSDAVNSMLIYVDAMLNYLMYRLDQRGLMGCINLVLVSDHGMQALRLDKSVKLWEYVNDSRTVLTMDGVISHIYLRDTNRTTPLEKFKELLCLKGEKFTVYSMETTPRRHHYTNNPRIGEVVLEAVPGIEIISKSRFDKFHDGGTHGYDNREPSMRAIFGALGPSFKKKFVIRPFQNIELYNFMSEAMRLSTPAPNNGTPGVLHHVFVNPPSYPQTSHKKLPICSPSLLKCGDSCHFELPLANLSTCFGSHFVGFPPSSLLCQINLCNASIVLDEAAQTPVLIETLLTDTGANLDHRSNCSLKLEFSNETQCQKMNFSGTFSLFPENNHLWFLEQTRLPAPKGFIEGIWTEFATLLGKYRRHYKTLRMFAGPIYDQNNDGIADEIQQKPTHIFVILLRCSIGTKWKSDFANCEDPTSTRVLSFALPIVEKDFNCLYPIEYLYRNTLRIRDVELLTGLEFFTDRQIYSDEVAISLRTFITESLWQLEQQNSDHH